MLTERIRTVMAAVFDVEDRQISNDFTSDEMEQWDSLNHMNLVVALEDEFDVRFEDDQLEQLTSLQLIESALKDVVSG